MLTDVVIAGFGGQGVMLIGKMIAYAGMRAGKEVSWLPSYGPEMRGGTANCTVVLSDQPVGSPVVEKPRALIAMNLPSLDKFEPSVTPKGVVIINSSLISRSALRKDVNAVDVPANRIAVEHNNPKGANMVILGAYLGATKALTLEVVSEVVRESFAQKPKLIEPNLGLLKAGYELGEKAVKEVAS